MLANWLIEYWWILVTILYVITMVGVALFLAGRGMFETVWPKITLAITCVTIVLIPTMHSPMSYVVAGVSVFNVIVLFRNLVAFNASSEPVDR